MKIHTIVFACACVLAVYATAHSAYAKTPNTEIDTLLTEHFEIEYEKSICGETANDPAASKCRSRGITKNQAEGFARQAEKALADVTTYLQVPAYKPIRISVRDSYSVPRPVRHEDIDKRKIQMPSSRIRGNAPGPRRLRGRGTALVNMISDMVLIPTSSNEDWGNLLTLSIGIFLQEKFGPPGDKSYPNLGQDLHEATIELALRYERILPAEILDTKWRERLSGRTRRLAMLQQGSIARYLIETFGVEKFMQVYRGDTFKRVFGKDMCTLEVDWLAHLTKLNPAISKYANKLTKRPDICS